MDKKQVKCPRCGNPTEYSAKNPFRPFCSERCQLVDLGQWAEGKYSIPVESPDNAPNIDDDDESNKSESSQE